MKILWLINIPLPEASIIMKQQPSPYGGWLVNSSKMLSEQEGIELSIAFPNHGEKCFVKLKGEKVNYYSFKPVLDYDYKRMEFDQILQEIINDSKPDIVHIYGTELAHTMAMINICRQKQIKAVISIQGLVSIIEKHITASLPFKAIYGFTLRNLLRNDNVRGLKSLYSKRGKKEIQAIRLADHIIGRTTWDKACVSQINPKAQYYHNYETLREEFYHHEWNIENCNKHSIFISQAQNPLKGLHFILEAMPLILNRYPDTKLFISGKNFTKSDTIKDKLYLTYYGKYIKKMIKNYKLEDHIEFVGMLDEKQMCKKFLQSNVYISASTIENESNSLSEAKMLGLPCIASYVGGVVDRINHNEDGFTYQHDAPYMLAYYVCQFFSDQSLTLQLSHKARENALKVHNKQQNINTLLDIYKRIVEQEDYDEQ